MQVSVRLVDRVVVQFGQSLGARTDCETIDLTENQAAQFQALWSVSNGGITIDAAGVLAALPVPAPIPNTLAPQVQRCRDYVVSTLAGDTADQLDQYLAAAIPTAVQTVAATKETIRTLRALIRVVRGMST